LGISPQSVCDVTIRVLARVGHRDERLGLRPVDAAWPHDGDDQPERIRSGIAAAKARGKRLGRQPGQRPKSDRLTPKVLALVAEGRSYRLIGRELGLSKNTVVEIIKRNRAPSAES